MLPPIVIQLFALFEPLFVDIFKALFLTPTKETGQNGIDPKNPNITNYPVNTNGFNGI